MRALQLWLVVNQMSKRGRYKSAQRNHLKKRAMERFGVRLTTEEIRKVILDIQLGIPAVLHRASFSRTAYLIEIKGIEAAWIYDSETKELVTVMSVKMYWDRPKVDIKKKRKLAQKKRKIKKNLEKKYGR